MAAVRYRSIGQLAIAKLRKELKFVATAGTVHSRCANITDEFTQFLDLTSMHTESSVWEYTHFHIHKHTII